TTTHAQRRTARRRADVRTRRATDLDEVDQFQRAGAPAVAGVDLQRGVIACAVGDGVIKVTFGARGLDAASMACLVETLGEVVTQLGPAADPPSARSSGTERCPE